MSGHRMASHEPGNLRDVSASRHAVVMRTYGLPDVLRVEPLPLPGLGPSEILIRTLAAAVNRSDLEIRSGNWPIRRDPPLPYVPGLEVLGEVATVGNDVVAVNVGDRVFTAMQGLGGVRALRDGVGVDNDVVGVA